MPLPPNLEQKIRSRLLCSTTLYPSPSAAIIVQECLNSLSLASKKDRIPAFRSAAEILADSVSNGSLEKQWTVDRLAQAAEAFDVTSELGVDGVQAVLAQAFVGSVWKPASRLHHGPSLVVCRASDIKPEPIEWLWPARVGIGKQTLLAGEAGLGKSQVVIAIAAAVTTGGAWPCGEGDAPLGHVIFLSAEDGEADTIIPRLLAAGADCDRVHLVRAVNCEGGKGRRSFNLQLDLDLLKQEIEKIGNVRLVVIDPISSYLGRVDSHKNADIRAVLEPIGEMAARHRVAVVSITHPPKGTGTTAINRFIGSVAFVAAARAAFMVTRDLNDEHRRLLLPVKNNLAPLGKGFAFRLEQCSVGNRQDCIVASRIAWEAGSNMRQTASSATACGRPPERRKNFELSAED